MSASKMSAPTMLRVICNSCGHAITLPSTHELRPCECGGTFNPVREFTKVYGAGVCASGKYRYVSFDAATRGQAGHRRRVRKAAMVYRCQQCRGWHLGSSIGRTGA